ncbi:MAG: hypothetical protein KHZ99_08565 [Clostridium sp.]|uniref:hypothetical protein n=1 Tax=Clostridium sp. TaxID=1506 RepID=UPI0025C2D925|nr:hypothetical protein [Clostridium sp.]MBS4957090.1 hypothetical protein [Clostridium sp.]
MKKELSFKGFILTFSLFLILLFQNVLEQYINILKYFDEGLFVLLFISAIYKVFRYRRDLIENNENLVQNNLIILFCMIILFVVGIAANIIYKYQVVPAIVADILLVFKGFISYVSITIIFNNISLEKYSKTINNTLRVISVLSFIMILTNYFFNIFPTKDIRFGLPSQRLLFTEPTYLATFAISVMILLTFFIKNYKKNIYFSILMSIVVCSTFRSKAIMFIAIYLLLYILIIIKDFRLNTKSIVGVGIVAAVAGGNQILRYLSNIDWARPRLMVKSFEVAMDHFPIGSGFATFATWNSGVYYSPLYYKYDLSNTWGLQPDFYMFVGDTYWPAILGQFGFIGLISIVVILIMIYKNICINKDKYKYFQQLSILLYLLVLSTGETSFMSPVATLLCVIMAI